MIQHPQNIIKIPKITKHMIDKHDKFANKKWKGVISEKAFPLVCSKYLYSWTGLGKSGHDQIMTIGPILHVLGSKSGF